jgi:hypothetical protein
MASLPFKSSSAWKAKSISVVENKSNGFLGNNHAVYAYGDGGSTYRYSYLDNPSSGLIGNVTDLNPLTYFEYEAISVNKSSTPFREAKSYEFLYSYEEVSGSSKVVKYKSWIDHNDKEPLKLVLSFKSDKPEKANTIDIIPFWGTDQAPSAQLKITKIVAIDKESKEIDLIDDPIYVGAALIPTDSNSLKNYFYDKVKLVFSEVITSEIQVYIEQNDCSEINIKHMYWKPLPSDGKLSSLNTQTRFDPSALSSLGFGEVQYNIFDLVPPITRPNIFKDQSDLFVKQLNITYKDQEKMDSYLISFQRQSGSSLIKYYYTNAFTGFETLEKQQEKAATTDINSAWKAESKDAAERIKLYIEGKISSDQWSSNNFQNINIETIKQTFNPKTYTATLSLKKDYEIYKAKRFAIGLRSIDIGYQLYESSSNFVSNTFEFPCNVKNLTISLNSKIDYSAISQNESLIKTYISVDEAKNWIRISPIENPFTGIPEVLSFNQFPKNGEKLKGIGYYNYPDIPSETKKIKVKIEIYRPRYSNTTPTLFSYKLIGRVEQT